MENPFRLSVAEASLITAALPQKQPSIGKIRARRKTLNRLAIQFLFWYEHASFGPALVL